MILSRKQIEMSGWDSLTIQKSIWLLNSLAYMNQGCGEYILNLCKHTGDREREGKNAFWHERTLHRPQLTKRV